jgi:hypothetical protein
MKYIVKACAAAPRTAATAASAITMAPTDRQPDVILRLPTSLLRLATASTPSVRC